MPIYTHDRIDLANGVLAKPGVLWGRNALQNIQIARHTPKEVQQAIGYLGIVDYTSGVITSDVTLDTILVEGCNKADPTGKTNSVYAFARQDVNIGSESYVATSVALAFRAGAPATVNYGFLTNTLASSLAIQAAPNPGTGEESDFAVVMGDDGSGIALIPSWVTGFTPTSATVPILDANGALTTMSDSGLPAGVQNLTMNARINRENILDVRSASPIQFVTTYPVDISGDMEVFTLISAAAGQPLDTNWNKLQDLAVQATSLNKHVTADSSKLASNGDVYAKLIGLCKTETTEGIQLGRHLQYTVMFHAADLIVPALAPS